MNTQVEKCKKMGGLRREFARLRMYNKFRFSLLVGGMRVVLSQLPRSRFKFRVVKNSHQIQESD